jgi:signal transduction histidine kinase
MAHHTPAPHIRGMSRRRWLFLLAVFGVFTFAGLSKFAYVHLDDLARGHDHPFQARLIEELTGAYAMALVFLVLVWVVNRWPMERENWYRRVPGYAVLVIVADLVHTTLMWGSRLVIFPLAGLGPYDYGIMHYRYPMEFAINGPNVAFLIGVLHAWRYYQSARRRELESAQLAAELNRARLERLEAQLQPHFLFNTLNAISSLMYHDPEAADRMLGRLSDLLRLTFARTPDPEAPLHSELEWLGWYLELMQLRFGGRLTIRQEIQAETLNLAVPRLILQPLVENALRHGAAKRAGPAEVTISACRSGDRLRLSVVDDGPGLSDPAGAGQNGVGLSNTSERLRVLYGEAGSFSLSNRPEGGLAATVELPVRQFGESNGR